MRISRSDMQQLEYMSCSREVEEEKAQSSEVNQYMNAQRQEKQMQRRRRPGESSAGSLCDRKTLRRVLGAAQPRSHFFREGRDRTLAHFNVIDPSQARAP